MGKEETFIVRALLPDYLSFMTPARILLTTHMTISHDRKDERLGFFINSSCSGAIAWLEAGCFASSLFWGNNCRWVWLGLWATHGEGTQQTELRVPWGLIECSFARPMDAKPKNPKSKLWEQRLPLCIFVCSMQSSFLDQGDCARTRIRLFEREPRRKIKSGHTGQGFTFVC